MFPSADQITDFFTSQVLQKGDIAAALHDFDSKIAEDIIFETPGKSFSLAVQGQGILPFKTYIATRIMPTFAQIFDAIPPRSSEVIRVTGGGDSPLAMVEGRTNFSRKGKFLYYHK